jgi:hypothetical protein
MPKYSAKVSVNCSFCFLVKVITCEIDRQMIVFYSPRNIGIPLFFLKGVS